MKELNDPDCTGIYQPLTEEQHELLIHFKISMENGVKGCFNALFSEICAYIGHSKSSWKMFHKKHKMGLKLSEQACLSIPLSAYFLKYI